MLAIFGNLDLMELALIAGAALLVFGGRLPEVVIRGARHVGRARRTLEKIWREAGIEQEMRDLRREIDVTAHAVGGAQKAVRTALDPYPAESFKPSFDPALEEDTGGEDTGGEETGTDDASVGDRADEATGVDPGSLGPRGQAEQRPGNAEIDTAGAETETAPRTGDDQADTGAAGGESTGS
jgi:Sec-independent protein translocase protein TatA